MTERTRGLLDQALELSEAERAELAGALLDSLGSHRSPEVEAAWRCEIASRLAALRAGEAEIVPRSEVRERLVSKLAL